MTTREYQDIGVNLAIIPGALQIAALAAQEALLRNVIEHGSARAYLQSAAGNAAMSTFYNSQGTAEVQAIESRFGGSPTDHE
jgi:2-methylisocitrate lyase-like PEP mutase family enzyme